MPRRLIIRIAIVVLAVVHTLGVLGAPFAARLHFNAPGATAHQNFHVVWEAFKYGTASLACLGIALKPLARGEAWAWWVMVASTAALFGGVFVADGLTGGAPAIDHWAYGSFLLLSMVSLGVLGIVDVDQNQKRG
jgi:hypothetical protein